jgi:exonuclease-1
MSPFRSRKENLERAREHEAAGNSRAAFECYQKAVDITPRIASELIEVQLKFLVMLTPNSYHLVKIFLTDLFKCFFKYAMQVLKKEKVDYIVAPYEADAQMTFLSVNKLVDAVITEDSDLIPFGCSRVSTLLQPYNPLLPYTARFPFIACYMPFNNVHFFFDVQIIFKMDKFGQGVEFQITRLERNRELDFNGFTRQMLLEMCILSGCDYLPSLPGMGVKRAHALIQKLKCHEKVNPIFYVSLAHDTIVPS